MKNIELTKEHKSKLLEMCKVLFPKYEISVNQVGEGFIDHVIFYKAHDQMYKTVQHYPPGKPFPKRLFKFHWFEFCMTHLLDRLHPDNDKQGKDNWSMDLSDKDYVIFKIIVRKRHPVDYLYEEFKKLK